MRSKLKKDEEELGDSKEEITEIGNEFKSVLQMKKKKKHHSEKREEKDENRNQDENEQYAQRIVFGGYDCYNQLG